MTGNQGLGCHQQRVKLQQLDHLQSLSCYYSVSQSLDWSGSKVLSPSTLRPRPLKKNDLDSEIHLQYYQSIPLGSKVGSAGVVELRTIAASHSHFSPFFVFFLDFLL